MWRQGEHLALVGSTGTGKTTYLEKLSSSRRYAINLLTKTDDLAWRTFRTIRKASDLAGAKPNPDGSVRLNLRPPLARRSDEFGQALRLIYRQGGWTVGIDELYEMQLLGLEPEVIQLYSEGRSEGVTVIGGMQRPSWVTRKGVSRWALSQPTHIVGLQTRDDRDKKILEEIVGRTFATRVGALSPFEFTYVNQVTQKMASGTLKTITEVL